MAFKFNPFTGTLDIVEKVDDLADLTTKNHSDLDQLVWSTAGHTIDTNVDFAGNNLLNVGSLFIDSTIDHDLFDSSDDLIVRNNNSFSDIKWNVNYGSFTYDALRTDCTLARVKVVPTTFRNYDTSGLLTVQDPMSIGTIGGCVTLSPTVTNGSFWVANLMQPVMNTSAYAIAFWLNPTSLGNYDKNLEMFRMTLPAHISGYNDNAVFMNIVGEPRGFFAIGVADNSSTTYKWFEMGGSVQIFDTGVANVTFLEEMIKLQGGLNRVVGSANGSMNQKGLWFTGFGTQSNLISGTDSCYAMYADGGAFWHKYDYTGWPATTKNGIYLGTGSATQPDAGFGYDGTNLKLEPHISGTGHVEVEGTIGTTVEEVSAATTLDETNSVELVDASGGARTITLPAASGVTNRHYWIKKIDSSANAVTVTGNASELVEGNTNYLLSNQYDSVHLVCDGTEWWVI